jgi:TolB-like protein/Flp pilus assembly protein TadD/predicted Ser/Thr protein kinase
MVGKRIRQYEIREELGRGGMGVVYKAHDTTLDRTVALKLVPEAKGASSEQRLRLLNEAKAAAGLNHPNICTVYEVGEDAGVQFIAIEYVEGHTLREYIERHRGEEPGLPVSEAAGIAAQIADALDEAHRRGIVHRDIKSENIMINARGQVKVMDFGLARLRGAARLTQSSSTVGTLAYMPPEAIQGGEADARSDLFSLGAVLYEMVAGRLPFRGEHEASMMYSILNENPVPLVDTLPDASPGLQHIIDRSLEKDPADRYQSASDMAIDLRRLKKDTGRVTRTSRPVVPPPEPARQVSTGSVPVGARRPEAAGTSGGKSPGGSTGVVGGEGLPGVADAGRRGGIRARLPWMIGSVAVLAALVVGGIFLFNRPGDTGEGDAPARKMVVVLPFENLGDAEMEYFADGMTEEITGKLASLSGLGVIGRSSALQYKKTSKSLKEIGGELGVTYVLEGTVRWEKTPSGESRVRVSPQLIRVSDATQLWSRPYEGVVSGVFAIQSEIAEKVAAALDVTLLADERATLHVGGTSDPEAYDLFLRGSAFRARSYAERDLRFAREMLQRAIERDPKFATAYAILSVTLSDLYWFRYEHTLDVKQLSKVHALKAEELQPLESSAKEALGWYYYHCELDYDQALTHFREAIRLRPQSAKAYEGMGAVNRRKGNFEEARNNYAEAVRLSPRDAIMLDQAAETSWLMRKFDEATELLDRAVRVNPENMLLWTTRVHNVLGQSGDTAKAALELRAAINAGIPLQDLQPELARVEMLSGNYANALRRIDGAGDIFIDDQFAFFPSSLVRSEVLVQLGKNDEVRTQAEAARQFLEQRVKSQPDDPRFHASLGIALARLGRKQEAIAAGRHAMGLLPIEKEAWRGAVLMEQMAWIHTILGDQEEAISLLDTLVSRPSRLSGPLLKIDPVWKNLRGNPRFQKLIQQSM